MKQWQQTQRGSAAIIAVVVLLIILFLGAAGFGGWAWTERQDYKDNVDAKIRTAIAGKTEEIEKKAEARFAEQAKQPLLLYEGPDQYGEVKIQYPRTWSVYAGISNGATPVDFYAHPHVVPATGQGDAYALRMQVLSRKYDTVVKQYEGKVRSGEVRAAPYVLPQNEGITGMRFDGQLEQNIQGSAVVLPMRDKTLRIWTESLDFVKDFNTIILENASFNP